MDDLKEKADEPGFYLRDHECETEGCYADFDLIITGGEMMQVEGSDTLLPVLKMGPVDCLAMIEMLAAAVRGGFRYEGEDDDTDV